MIYKLKKWPVPLITFIIGLVLAVPALATSNDFLAKASNYYQEKCTKPKVPDSTAINCYLFDKLLDLENALVNSNQRITNLEADSAIKSSQINDMQIRVTNLENLIPSPFPSPTLSPGPLPTIVFAQNRPASFITDFIQIPNGYTSMTFHVTTTGSLYGWAPIANVNSFVNEQHRILCPNNICPNVTIPIISGLYKFSTGTSSGNITATATLNSETSNYNQVLGYAVDLPFASTSFPTNSNTKIEVTVGQTNPQNLTGISLQRNESGIFVEKHHIVCDGGAVCPLTDLPLLGGEYRVVVEGSGPGALIAVLIRPN
jgi:hypothetical protein